MEQVSFGPSRIDARVMVVCQESVTRYVVGIVKVQTEGCGMLVKNSTEFVDVFYGRSLSVIRTHCIFDGAHCTCRLFKTVGIIRLLEAVI